MNNVPFTPVRSVAIPSDRIWLDPYFVYQQLYTKTSIPEWSFPGTGSVAPANPYRWAIGFTADPAFFASTNVAPWGTVAQANGWLIQTSQWLWFNCQEFGSLVMDEWFRSSNGAGGCMVIEVIRRP